MVAKAESRRGTPVLWIATHTNEGEHLLRSPDLTAENLARYLDSENLAGRYKSYHLICDDDSTVRYVPDDQAAWAMPGGGNLPALQLCFTGWAHWARQDWLAHKAMLVRGAAEVARWSKAFNIPAVKRTPQEVARKVPGVIGHIDWTNSAPGRGDHTDPGANFPWPEFISLVNEQLGGSDLNAEQDALLHEIRGQLAGNQTVGEWPGWPARPDNSPDAKTLVDYVRATHAMQRVQSAQIQAILAKLDTLGTPKQ